MRDLRQYRHGAEKQKMMKKNHDSIDDDNGNWDGSGGGGGGIGEGISGSSENHDHSMINTSSLTCWSPSSQRMVSMTAGTRPRSCITSIFRVIVCASVSCGQLGNLSCMWAGASPAGWRQPRARSSRRAGRGGRGATWVEADCEPDSDMFRDKLCSSSSSSSNAISTQSTTRYSGS